MESIIEEDDAVKKRMMVLCAAILLGLFFRQTVFAAPAEDGGRAAIVSAYGLEKELYTFVRFDESCEPEKLSGNLLSGGGMVEGEASPYPLRITDTAIHYVLMVDLSTSMQKHIGTINGFVDGLAEAGQQRALFSVMTFGDQFEVVSEKLKDVGELRTVVQNLQYQDQMTDPYEGIERAADYLSTVPRESGELVNLILITDGKIYLGEISAGERQTMEAEKAQKASEVIVSSPEMILHTLCTGEWEKTAFQTFSQGTGVDVSVNGRDPRLPAQELVGFVDRLYRLDFYHRAKEGDPRFDIQLQFTGEEDGMMLVLNSERKAVPVLKKVEQPMAESDDELPPADKEDPTPPKVDDGLRAKDQIKDQIKDQKYCISKRLFLLVVVGLLLIAIVALSVLLLRKWKKGKRKEAGESERWTIHMKPEVLSGKLRNPDRQICLRDELLIGSGRKCDMVWSDKCVSKKNSRIYIEEQIIYIEDLDSKEGTALGGMRLHAPNRLRSGDVVSIGNVSFILRF